MSYIIKIIEQETGKEIREEIETLKQLKWILMQYQNNLIDFEMREKKGDDRNVRIMGEKKNKR